MWKRTQAGHIPYPKFSLRVETEDGIYALERHWGKKNATE